MSSNTIASIRRSHIDVLSNFIATYNSLSKSLPVRAKSPIQKYAALMRAAVFGAASTYNPYLEENGSQEKQTQLRGQRRFKSICGNNLVAFALAKIMCPPLL